MKSVRSGLRLKKSPTNGVFHQWQSKLLICFMVVFLKFKTEPVLSYFYLRKRVKSTLLLLQGIYFFSDILTVWLKYSMWTVSSIVYFKHTCASTTHVCERHRWSWAGEWESERARERPPPWDNNTSLWGARGASGCLGWKSWTNVCMRCVYNWWPPAAVQIAALSNIPLSKMTASGLVL